MHKRERQIYGLVTSIATCEIICSRCHINPNGCCCCWDCRCISESSGHAGATQVCRRRQWLGLRWWAFCVWWTGVIVSWLRPFQRRVESHTTTRTMSPSSSRLALNTILHSLLLWQVLILEFKTEVMYISCLVFFGYVLKDVIFDARARRIPVQGRRILSSNSLKANSKIRWWCNSRCMIQRMYNWQAGSI